MLDSDNLPLVNPETLFESKGYKKHGNLFWPDYWDAIQGNQPGWLSDSAYTLFGLDPPWQEDPSGFATTETGQILINRCAHSLFPQPHLSSCMALKKRQMPICLTQQQALSGDPSSFATIQTRQSTGAHTLYLPLHPLCMALRESRIPTPGQSSVRPCLAGVL